ncbi:alpha/beta hydrolase family protein [Streptomyces sp. AC495_CC817]|uniref:alpha/beta hydrolase n=1 Tax=Streptomyces sp. AC495_CC817 TaxID=2823900 RepID=UPI0027DF32D4|nr:alpha/beta hydrolase family protein [Streptomyces sp. AC495_CC817]
MRDSDSRTGTERFDVVSRDGTVVRGVHRPGPGETVVLVHGIAMDHRIWWESGFLDGLPGAHIVALDLRGRGDSPHVGTPEGHGMARYVDDLRAVLDRFGQERYTLVGTYFGGRLALHVAAADTRVTRVLSFCAHGEGVDIPPGAVEDEASAIEGPDGQTYLRDHFTKAGAPPWMVDACDRVDRGELAAATRGLLHGSHHQAERGRPEQDLVLITSASDTEMETFRASEKRLGARLLLVESPTRVQAAAHLGHVGRQVAELLGPAGDVADGGTRPR